MIELDFASNYEGYDYLEEKYTEIIEVAFSLLGLSFSPIISVSIVDNAYIHEINKTYRGIDRETDVISFAFLDGDKNKDKLLKSNSIVSLGDIYISLEKAQEQANSYGHSLNRELLFLFTHGLLHLLGYDHMKKEDEEIMFPLQDKILENIEGAER